MKKKFLLLFSVVLIVVVMVLAFMPGLAMPAASDELAVFPALSYGEANLNSALMVTGVAPATYNVAELASAAVAGSLNLLVAVLIFSIIAIIVATSSNISGTSHYLQSNLEARLMGRCRTKFILPA